MRSQRTVVAEAGIAASAAVSIRKADAGDAAALAELMTQLGYPTTEDEMSGRLRRILSNSDYLVAVAVRLGRVVGVIGAFIGLYLEMNGRYGRVIALSVATGYPGRGIGARLLAHAESWLRAHEAVACIVSSSTHRTGAHRFYQREGYQATGWRFYKKLQSRGPG